MKKNKKVNTRDRLIEESIGLFAKYGLDGVSIRQIISRCKVNVCSISYHFSGKEGLYEACIRRLIDKSIESFKPLREQVELLRAENCKDRGIWRNLLKEYLKLAIAKITSEDFKYGIQFFLRAQISKSRYAEMYFKEVWWPAKKDYLTLIENLTGKQPPEIMEMKFMSIIGMSYALTTSKYYTSNLDAAKYDSSDFQEKYIDYIIKGIESV